MKKDLEYKLVFNNKKSGKTITAVTELVDNVIRPFALSTPTINIVDNNPLDIKFPTVENGKVYGLHVLFYYREKKLTEPDSSYKLKNVDYVFADIVASSTGASNQNLEFLMKGEDFFSFIGGRIVPDNTLI